MRHGERYIERLIDPSWLPPLVTPPFPGYTSGHSTFSRATADLRYTLGRRWAAGFTYLFDDYDVEDFAFGPETLTSVAQPSFLSMRARATYS